MASHPRTLSTSTGWYVACRPGMNSPVFKEPVNPADPAVVLVSGVVGSLLTAETAPMEASSKPSDLKPVIGGKKAPMLLEMDVNKREPD